jgi:hypothetical protein
MVFSLLFNGFFLAFIYSQMSKSELRATQVLFSDKLCILVDDGKVYASVRCYDLDSSYPLVEAHARFVCHNDSIVLLSGYSFSRTPTQSVIAPIQDVCAGPSNEAPPLEAQ